MTIVSTAVTETTESPSGVAGTLVVTSTGSIVNDNNDDGVDTTAMEQLITIDGLVYSGGTEGFGVDITKQSATLYVNGQVQGVIGVGVIEVTGAAIRVGSQGSIVGLDGVGVAFSGPDTGPTDDVLQNAGEISSSFEAVQDEQGGGDEISNTGLISGLTAVLFGGNVATDTIDNSGTIEGGNAADAAAIAAEESTAGIDIVNSGLITDGAANAAGVGRAVLYFNDSPGTASTIDNTGSISGAGYVIQSVSDSLDISNSGTIHGGLESTATVDVDNSGVWKDQAGSAPVFVLDGGNNSVTNTASGVIDGAISTAHSHDTFDNAGSIDGSLGIVSGGDTITNSGGIDGPITFTSSGNTNSLTNSGKITGSVALSGGENAVDNSGTIDGELSVAHSDDTFNNAGAIDGLVSIAAGSDTVTNAGTIDGQLMLWSTGTDNSVTNAGDIVGDVTLPGSSSLINSGTVHGDVILGASDTLDLSTGLVTGVVDASSSDLFEFSGDFGKVTFDDFVAGSGSTHDTIQFAANDFSTFSQIQSASSQAGADVVIKLDATDSITLNNVTLASLVSADFTFV